MKKLTVLLLAILFGSISVQANENQPNKESHTEKNNAISLAENQFIGLFIEYIDGKLMLDITLQMAVKAGATVDGYNQTLKLVADYNENLTQEEMAEFVDFLNKMKAELITYADKHPSKSAIKQIKTVARHLAH